MAKYAIWDKVSPVITPIGEVLSAEQWIDRYPMAGLDSVTVVCAAGEINGGFFGTLNQMMELYPDCDFSTCATPEEVLAAMEAWDVEREAEAEAKAAAEAEAKAAAEAEALATQQSIAASLEYQNMMNY